MSTLVIEVQRSRQSGQFAARGLLQLPSRAEQLGFKQLPKSEDILLAFAVEAPNLKRDGQAPSFKARMFTFGLLSEYIRKKRGNGIQVWKHLSDDGEILHIANELTSSIDDFFDSIKLP